MKREFLKELGIEDAETVKKILDENMADIGNAKTTVKDEMQSQIDNLTTQLADRDSQLEKLKDVDAEALKDQIEKLQADNADAKKAYEDQLDAMKLQGAVKDALIEANAKDITSVMKLLDMAEVKFDKKGNLLGVEEQLNTLKSGELTKVFFGSTVTNPAGTNPAGGATPPVVKKPSEMTYEELSKYMTEHPDVDINSLG